MFLVKRLRDDDCYSCGGVVTTFAFVTDNETLARDWITAATIELEAAQAAAEARFANEDREINRTNWLSWAEAALVLDKDWFAGMDEHARFARVYDVQNYEYELDEVESR